MDFLSPAIGHRVEYAQYSDCNRIASIFVETLKVFGEPWSCLAFLYFAMDAQVGEFHQLMRWTSLIFFISPKRLFNPVTCPPIVRDPREMGVFA